MSGVEGRGRAWEERISQAQRRTRTYTPTHPIHTHRKPRGRKCIDCGTRDCVPARGGMESKGHAPVDAAARRHTADRTVAGMTPGVRGRSCKRTARGVRGGGRGETQTSQPRAEDSTMPPTRQRLQTRSPQCANGEVLVGCPQGVRGGRHIHERIGEVEHGGYAFRPSRRGGRVGDDYSVVAARLQVIRGQP